MQGARNLKTHCGGGWPLLDITNIQSNTYTFIIFTTALCSIARFLEGVETPQISVLESSLLTSLSEEKHMTTYMYKQIFFSESSDRSVSAALLAFGMLPLLSFQPGAGKLLQCCLETEGSDDRQQHIAFVPMQCSCSLLQAITSWFPLNINC